MYVSQWTDKQTGGQERQTEGADKTDVPSTDGQSKLNRTFVQIVNNEHKWTEGSVQLTLHQHVQYCYFELMKHFFTFEAKQANLVRRSSNWAFPFSRYSLNKLTRILCRRDQRRRTERKVFYRLSPGVNVIKYFYIRYLQKSLCLPLSCLYNMAYYLQALDSPGLAH